MLMAEYVLVFLFDPVLISGRREIKYRMYANLVALSTEMTLGRTEKALATIVKAFDAFSTQVLN